ncbi:hypothetical protein EDD36DRAFT_419490 [Exophiala viscosa]|uniref:Transmembrane protein n=1 Tax=Exophiala viscosa TaxID=2486360 RepID=A0AAN6DXZ7_9EURO|nr:hypothetical protein EDD36DRAFT_419490 [Exophiala viscosa]
MSRVEMLMCALVHATHILLSMIGGNIDILASRVLESIRSHCLSLLSVSLGCCIVVAIWLSSRTRGYNSERHVSVRAMSRPDLLADAKDCPAAFLDTVSAMEAGQLPPLTSGYLAALADMKAFHDTTDGHDQRFSKGGAPAVMGPPTSEAQTSSTPDDQQVPWRRHSYPSAQKQDGLLHDTSKQDETQYLLDERDGDVIWRRRTLVFEGKT